MRKIAILILLAAGSAFTVFGDALPEGKWWKNPRVVERLQLSGGQVDSLEKIFLRTRPTLIDLRADLEKKRLVLQSSMEDRKVDSADASRRIDDVEHARADLAKARATMFVEFRRVLRPDQWDRLRTIAINARERRRERFRDRGDGSNRP